MNSWLMEFSDCIDYSAYSEITIKVSLFSELSRFVSIEAKLDTASTFCVFHRDYAAILGFELERGVRERIRTATGSFLAYGHEVTMMVRDIEWQAMVFFAEPENFPVNVVGRFGFLNRLRFGLVDYEQLLYLAAYDAA